MVNLVFCDLVREVPCNFMYFLMGKEDVCYCQVCQFEKFDQSLSIFILCFLVHVFPGVFKLLGCSHLLLNRLPSLQYHFNCNDDIHQCVVELVIPIVCAFICGSVALCDGQLEIFGHKASCYDPFIHRLPADKRSLCFGCHQNCNTFSMFVDFPS